MSEELIPEDEPDDLSDIIQYGSSRLRNRQVSLSDESRYFEYD